MKERKKNLLYFLACLFGALLCGLMIFLFGGSRELQVITTMIILKGLWFEIRFRRMLGQLR